MNFNLRTILDDIANRFILAVDYSLEQLFSDLDKDLWENSNHNPITFLKNFKKEIITADDYKTYISTLTEKYFSLIEKSEKVNSPKIAYFSPEFGFHESFPNYAGGLGILAGDIIKTSAVNNSGMIGVGLLYSKGYFRQSISKANNQIAKFERINLNDLPLETLKNSFGEDIIIEIEIFDYSLKVKAYKLQILNTFVIFLSTDFPENGIYSKITDLLYTGSREERLLQEIVLGIGGVRILEKAGIKIEKYHINEGHAAFALLERARQYAVQNKIDFKKALNYLLPQNLFTTHTPVIHGNEEFKTKLIIKHLSKYLSEIGLTYDEFLSWGQTTLIEKNMFSMTALGINLSGQSNGVSKLHGETAKEMWAEIYNRNKETAPMTYVTNGIHIRSWLAPEIERLLSFKDNNYEKFVAELNNITGIEISSTKSVVKNRMLKEIGFILNKRNPIFAENFHNSLQNYKDCLTIGFARRFAKYKRADLIFNDLEKLPAILKNPKKPVRIFFSGKAHPKDTDGKAILKNVLISIQKAGLSENIIFIPDYDIRIGRLLVQGCDIWLNTPEKPLEACGTSGMKNALNLGINLSITDGWWYEAYNGTNGFGLEDSENPAIVSNSIYETLEKKVIPMYYDNTKSNNWSEMMKQSFITAVSQFNSERMLEDYKKIF